MLLKNNLSVFFGIFLVSMILVPNVSAQEVTIPDWIKNNAGWWADGQIDDSSFVETIEFNSEPKYGWPTTPVVFSINHDQFGNIGLKTEIYEQGE